jgi:hypothetical protein
LCFERNLENSDGRLMLWWLMLNVAFENSNGH